MTVKRAVVQWVALIALFSNCTGQLPGDVKKKTQPQDTVKTQKAAVVVNEKTWPLQLTVSTDREKCIIGKKGEVFLLVKFDAPEQYSTPNDFRPDINLSLVLDRSGSMEEKNKLVFVKKAAEYVVDKMTNQDKLGIVEYDDKISQLWPLSKVTSSDIVKQLIRSLSPRGSTNLCGGLIYGVEQLKAAISNDNVNRVILLSDGLANTGITDPSEIARLTREARLRGLTISTMGVGLDYNEDLLQNIAQCGGGKYYYVENPVQIGEIFQEEIGSLFKTVAKNFNVEFIGEPCVDTAQVYGYEASIEGNHANAALGNVYSGGKGMVLMRFHTMLTQSGKQNLGKLSVSFYDCTTNKTRQKEISLFIDGVKDSADVSKSINQSISSEATLIVADNEHEEYVRQFENGDKAIAQRNLDALSKKMESINNVLSDVRIKKKITSIRMETTEMQNAEKSIENRQAYLKTSKQRFYYAKKGDRGKYIMQKGDNNFDVKQLQKQLTNLKVYNGQIDGKFSDSVATAVKQFQQSNAIEADGVAGPETLKKLGLY